MTVSVVSKVVHSVRFAVWPDAVVAVVSRLPIVVPGVVLAVACPIFPATDQSVRRI